MPDDVAAEAQHVLAAAERARRHLAAVGANDVLPDDPHPGVALPLWRGQRFLLPHPAGSYDHARDLWWPDSRGFYRRVHQHHGDRVLLDWPHLFERDRASGEG